jgi:hypothetical protein
MSQFLGFCIFFNLTLKGGKKSRRTKRPEPAKSLGRLVQFATYEFMQVRDL